MGAVQARDAFRLLFYATEAGGERLVVRTFEPDPTVQVLETAMHR